MAAAATLDGGNRFAARLAGLSHAALLELTAQHSVANRHGLSHAALLEYARPILAMI